MAEKEKKYKIVISFCYVNSILNMVYCKRLMVVVGNEKSFMSLVSKRQRSNFGKVCIHS